MADELLRRAARTITDLRHLAKALTDAGHPGDALRLMGYAGMVRGIEDKLIDAQMKVDAEKARTSMIESQANPAA